MQNLFSNVTTQSSVCSTNGSRVSPEISTPESEEDLSNQSTSSRMLMSFLKRFRATTDGGEQKPTPQPALLDGGDQKSTLQTTPPIGGDQKPILQPVPADRGKQKPSLLPILPKRTSSTSGTQETDETTLGSNEGEIKHRRYRSWPSKYGTSNPLPRVLPKYSGTPKMNAFLRVQPHKLHHPSSRIPTLGNVWGHDRFLDVFVHPSTLPEVYHHLRDCGNDSFLAQLLPVTPPYKEEKQPQELKEAEDEFEETSTAAAIFGYITGSSGYESISSAEGRGLTALVVRLCFATKIRCSGSQMREEICGLADDKQSQQLEGADEILIKVGHIVMSDLVRQQLQFKACSQVRLREAKEEWKLPLAFKPVTITLQTLDQRDVSIEYLLQCAFVL